MIIHAPCCNHFLFIFCFCFNGEFSLCLHLFIPSLQQICTGGQFSQATLHKEGDSTPDFLVWTPISKNTIIEQRKPFELIDNILFFLDVKCIFSRSPHYCTQGLSQNRVDKWHYVVNRKHRKM